MASAFPVSKLTATAAVVASTGAVVGVGAFTSPGHEPTANADPGGESSAAAAEPAVDAALAARAEATRQGAAPPVSRAGTRPLLASVQRAAKARAMSPAKADVSGAVTEKVAPTSPQEIAMGMLKKYGWSSDQFGCLNDIYLRESNWSPSADNPASGAYGIPQALPGDKMAAYGADWQTNPATQLAWGLAYIRDRYGSPCGAWGFWESHGWY
jgi:hypothetical protein